MTVLYRDVALAFRLAILVFAIAMGIFALLACASIADAATLKSEAVLAGTTLTAGDLFEGLEKDKAAYALGPAPQPGHDMTLDALTLMRVAARLNFEWKPQSMNDKIVVRSAATIVDDKTIAEALKKKLQEQGLQGNFSISLLNAPKLVLGRETPAAAEVVSLSFHAESDRFEATLAGPSAAHPEAKIEVTGHVERVVSLPVLKRPLRNGEIVRADNVDWIEIPARSIQADNILEAEQLIGKTPRRMVLANQAIRASEILQPLMVSRGQAVTIVYEKGPIMVTAKGKALEDGAHGSLIHVVNTASNRSIDATVSDDGLVTVTE